MKYKTFCWAVPAYAGIHRSCNNSRRNAKTPNRAESLNHYETRWSGKGSQGFGVRRPLRYLSHRLQLEENQVRRLASVLNQLKTEREQAALDERRTVAKLAALLTQGTPTLEECQEPLSGRVEAAQHLADETAKAIVAISHLLEDDQREDFVDLLQSGEFSL